MAQRVLLAETDDTIRGVAETVLRQNGFEVIAVNSSDKASEILEFSVPDLLLIDATLSSDKGRLCYQSLQEAPRSASVPMLLLADAFDPSLGMPAEAVLVCPFDPADLVRRAKAALGPSGHQGAVDPLAEANLNDDFLDAALGLDDIEVTSSEDMNKTGFIRTKVSSAGNEDGDTKIMGVGHFAKENKRQDITESSKIESLMITDEDSDIRVQSPKQPAPPPGPEDSAGLQIMSDQYGLSAPDAFMDRPESDNHDYAWFVDSVRSDQESPQGKTGANKSANDSHELTFSDPAKALDPITPGPQSTIPPVSTGSAPAQASGSEGGMDKFIDEFRQEVERLGDEGPEEVVIPDEISLAQAQRAEQRQTRQSGKPIALADAEGADHSIDWEDKIEKITPEHMRLFSREVALRLADKIAAMILARIDQDKLLKLIKDEVVAQAKQKPQS